MKSFLLSLCTIFIVVNALCQDNFRKNTLYVELLGNGGALSINYERQLMNKPGLGIHIGAGLGDTKIDIPTGLIYLFELKNKKSFLETGAGITFAEQSLWQEHFSNEPGIHNYKPGFIFSIGYRHHTSYGLMWRINYTPIFTKYRDIPFFFGCSAGWII